MAHQAAEQGVGFGFLVEGITANNSHDIERDTGGLLAQRHKQVLEQEVHHIPLQRVGDDCGERRREKKRREEKRGEEREREREIID
jgi:hypothetical protein